MATYRGVAATAIRQLESRVLHAEEAVKAGLADQVADFSEAFRAFQHFVKSGGTKSPVKPAVAAAVVSSPKLTGLEALTAQIREQIRPGLEAKLTAELGLILAVCQKAGQPLQLAVRYFTEGKTFPEVTRILQTSAEPVHSLASLARVRQCAHKPR